jgi:hypothetical protein
MNILANSSKDAAVTKNTNIAVATSYNKHKVYSGRKYLSLGGFVYLLSLLPKPMVVTSFRLLVVSSTPPHIAPSDKYHSILGIQRSIARNTPFIVSATRVTTDVPTIQRQRYTNSPVRTKALFAYNHNHFLSSHNSSSSSSSSSSRTVTIGTRNTTSTDSSRNTSSTRLFATSSPKLNMYHLDSIGSTQDEARRILQDETLHGTLLYVVFVCIVCML